MDIYTLAIWAVKLVFLAAAVVLAAFCFAILEGEE